MSIKWGLSVADWHDHAIDDPHDHPVGVFTARCGHSLMMVTPLRETSCGTKCDACAVAVSETDTGPT